MALEKQPIKINFAKGLNNKVDQKQLPVGNFQTLNNVTFGTLGEMKKRNGYAQQGTLSSNNYKNITTLNDNLVTIGTRISSFNQPNTTWNNAGQQFAGNLNVLSLIRSEYPVIWCESAVYQSGSNDGIVLATWSTRSGASAPVGFYQLFNLNTGAALSEVYSLNGISNNARVYSLPSYLLIVIADGTNLKYRAFPVSNIASPTAFTSLASDYATYYNNGYYSFDAGSDGTKLFFSYQSAASGVKVFTLTDGLVQSATTTISSTTYATTIGTHCVVVDTTNSRVFFTYLIDGVTKYATYTTALALVTGTTNIDSNSFTHSAAVLSGVLYVVMEQSATLGYTPQWSGVGSTRNDIVYYRTATHLGVVGSAVTTFYGIGLVSGAQVSPSGTDIYIVGCYGYNNSTNLQPSLFLISLLSGANQNSTTAGTVVGRLAYSNAGGYEYSYLGAPRLLRSTIASVDTYIFPYLFGFQTQAITKATAGSTSGVYQQIGANLAIMPVNSPFLSKETAKSLHISGPILNQFDNKNAVEHGFMLWPDNITTTTSGTAGAFTVQQYYYQAVYEWTDNNGIIHRSAPSSPTGITPTAGRIGIRVFVPYLNLTNKEKVRLVLYRWSTAQQNYHQVSSITSPTPNSVNNTSQTYAEVLDTATDASIAGNTILYTTGGIVENIEPGSCFSPVLYRSRLVVISSENPNQLWYSKQIVDATPVEFNDGFTLFVASGSSNSSTSPVKALGELDDRLIVFKNNAIYYITGQGPDNTGANNDFSDPITISSPVGCSNPASIINTDVGLMFQASNGSGIWLLDRKLQVTYVGNAVANYNSYDVKSASLVPGTTEVRFNMSNGIILMYDFFVDQWGTFTNVPNDFGIASTISNGTYHYLSSACQVWKETPGTYTDGANNILMNFKTGWLSLLGLQGYQRTYWCYFLGKYLTPHNFTVSLTYDYAQSAAQTVTVDPDSVAPTAGDLEQWRIFLTQQKCEALQIEFQEVYTSSQGASLTLSGINLMVGAKLHYPKNDFSGSAS